MRKLLRGSAAWLILGSFVAVSPAYPWGNEGHEIVAYIAEARLTPGTLHQIKALLPKKSTVEAASIWPDKVGRQITDMNSFHYISFPADAVAYDRNLASSRNFI